jgi:hypothetical protein
MMMVFSIASESLPSEFPGRPYYFRLGQSAQSAINMTKKANPDEITKSRPPRKTPPAAMRNPSLHTATHAGDVPGAASDGFGDSDVGASGCGAAGFDFGSPTTIRIVAPRVQS